MLLQHSRGRTFDTLLGIPVPVLHFTAQNFEMIVFSEFLSCGDDPHLHIHQNSAQNSNSTSVYTQSFIIDDRYHRNVYLFCHPLGLWTHSQWHHSGRLRSLSLTCACTLCFDNLLVVFVTVSIWCLCHSFTCSLFILTSWTSLNLLQLYLTWTLTQAVELLELDLVCTHVMQCNMHLWRHPEWARFGMPTST